MTPFLNHPVAAGRDGGGEWGNCGSGRGSGRGWGRGGRAGKDSTQVFNAVPGKENEFVATNAQIFHQDIGLRGSVKHFKALDRRGKFLGDLGV